MPADPAESCIKRKIHDVNDACLLYKNQISCPRKWTKERNFKQ